MVDETAPSSKAEHVGIIFLKGWDLEGKEMCHLALLKRTNGKLELFEPSPEDFSRERELRNLMNSRMVNVEMSEADVLLLHGMACLSDGRNSLIKIIRRTISPVALDILRKRPEYIAILNTGKGEDSDEIL